MFLLLFQEISLMSSPISTQRWAKTGAHTTMRDLMFKSVLLFIRPL